MSIAGAALALLGVAAAPARIKERKHDALKRRIAELENWTRRLEDALDAERSLCAHWREEARVLAARLQAFRIAEAAREVNDNLARYQSAQMNQQAFLQAQGQALAGQQMQNAQAQNMGLYANCTPSRLEGLVGRLNRE